MAQTIEAIYENGVFRPLEPENLNIPNGQRVQVFVVGTDEDPLKQITSVLDGLSPAEIDEFKRIALRRSNILELAAKVYEGLSDSEIDEVERIALARSAARSGI